DALADGAAEFSTAVVKRMDAMSDLTDRLDKTFTSLRELYEREVAGLRTQLASVAAAAARESAFTGRLLTEARREIDALNGKVQRQHDRERINAKFAHMTEALHSNVLSFAQKVPEDGAA